MRCHLWMCRWVRDVRERADDDRDDILMMKRILLRMFSVFWLRMLLLDKGVMDQVAWLI